MKRKLEVTELIFKIISYTLLTIFALACLYPFIYAVSASISGVEEVQYNRVVLFPKNVQFLAFSRMFKDNMFWNSYTNTLFITLYGTIWALFSSILAGYALSKKRLLFLRRGGLCYGLFHSGSCGHTGPRGIAWLLGGVRDLGLYASLRLGRRSYGAHPCWRPGGGIHIPFPAGGGMVLPRKLRACLPGTSQVLPERRDIH